MTKLGLITLSISLIANVAIAGVPEMKACGKGLDTPSRKIFDAVVVALRANPSADPETVVRSKTMDLVKSGDVPVLRARKHALAAVDCLKKAQN
ncbi:MAG: hypothetical protein AAF393_04990 [Pseudomonadota bacterium]